MMHAETALEFAAVRAVLGRWVRSALGRDRLEELSPVSNRAAIEAALADAAEAIDYVAASGPQQTSSRGAAVRISFGDIDDPREAVARLRIEGATLDGLEIYQLIRVLDLASHVRSSLTTAAGRFPRLAAQAQNIADLRDLSNDLTGKVLPSGLLADHASVALGRLRREIEKQKASIQQSLERFLKAHRQDGTLQEDFVTIRNDRFVVPIVAGRERGVDGVVHGASGSGHTMFVEPLETISLNNELVRLSEEEMREVHRILREFTQRLRVHSKEISGTAAALGQLELIFAKAEFAQEFNAVVPRISTENHRRMVLSRARHPLLEDILRRQGKSVVPVSFELDQQRRTLLISGPNTGGKTVALKTAGLLALMAHAGLPVPALEAEFPLFDEVLADIGDHQSLAESLSTFSGHIVVVKEMLEHATPESLVLIDELGRATDPEEGGALGVAILETLHQRGLFTLASTHLTALKVYGASADGVLNAAMGFDPDTLSPTYVLRVGSPGKSAGLDIAARLGLHGELIAKARSRMTSNERDIANFLASMQQSLERAEAERNTLAERERVLSERERRIEQDWEKKYQGKVREVEQRAAQLSAEFEQRAAETLGTLSQKARAQVARTRREFQESIAAIAPAAPRAVAPPAQKLAAGLRVRLKEVRQPATVRRVLENGIIEVEAGFLRMQVPAADVEEILIAAPTKSKPSVEFHQSAPMAASYRELNLIGQRVEEACAQADKFLDNAALAEIDRVRIIHGHGMGILKRAINALLAGHPHVAKYYGAGSEEGGAGATIVEMKT